MVQILVDPMGHEGTGKAHYQHARSREGDEVNGPRMATPADQIEVSGVAFVAIGMKTHGNCPPHAVEPSTQFAGARNTSY
jgi:hypothetical protein